MSKPHTEPPMRQAYSETSKWARWRMPLLPARMFAQFSCTLRPSGLTMPSPVTTTRLLLPTCLLAPHSVITRQPSELRHDSRRVPHRVRYSLLPDDDLTQT